MMDLRQPRLLFLAASSSYLHGQDVVPVRVMGDPKITHFGFPWFTAIMIASVKYLLARGDIEQAIKHIEESRAKFWTHLRGFREPFHLLPSPFDLTLSRLAATLRRRGLEDALSHGSPYMPSAAMDPQLRQDLDGWYATLEQIRTVPGYERFNMPVIMPDIMAVAKNGPVVILGAYQGFSDAYAVILSDPQAPPQYLSLPIAEEKLNVIHTKFEEILRRQGNSALLEQREHSDTETLLHEVLTDLWIYICEPIVKHMGLEADVAPPRVWWCPIGELEKMPIHAAGLHPSGPCLSDFIISSYTPTLNSLLEARERVSQSPGNKVLIVAQPETPGLPFLPNAALERDEICKIVPENLLVPLTRNATEKDGSECTLDAVVSALSEASIAHFACHGAASREHPLESALFLYDGDLTVARILYTDMPHASIAFLSACHGSATDPFRPDQVVNLATGMLEAGFQTVIAALWSMEDKVGPELAKDVYATLFDGGGPQPDRAAFALHKALRNLRKKHARLLSWVPFVHIGV
ncbi:hypothetical protein GALMADRAFT_427120 [Galerina marginata CBS 339.88]|uniref:CHAT domain-containing protein n=1 Tax=Galerina marginata (strain CBS 339.88) TaxID=685588 RepID=A0A067TDL3_GALM3|nr:hypothetical protein GALMADRAFT_427120 [Galerina marginata CBS 339.88]